MLTYIGTGTSHPKCLKMTNFDRFYRQQLFENVVFRLPNRQCFRSVSTYNTRLHVTLYIYLNYLQAL